MTDRKPFLVLGYGNPGRGDDAAGPELVRRIEEELEPELRDRLETVVAWQLMIEHAELLNDRMAAVFIDASRDAPRPYRLSRVMPERDRSYTSHRLSPRALVEVQRRAFGRTLERCWLLEIPASRFALGEDMSADTAGAIAAALPALLELVRDTLGSTAGQLRA